MFKKLISNLPFNPSLITQVSFYAKRVRRESAIRRTGLLILLAAMGIQIFAVIAPPQATLASSPNDIITGGVSSLSQLVGYCQGNFNGLKDIYAYYGITCDNVSHASQVSLNSRAQNSQLYSMGRLAYGKAGETPVNINGITYFFRYLWSWDTGASSTYTAYQFTNNAGKTFYTLSGCGNLVSIGLPASPAAPAITQKTNIPGYPAANATVAPGQVLGYRINFVNSGGSAAQHVIVEDPEPANTTIAWQGDGGDKGINNLAIPGQAPSKHAYWIFSSMPVGATGYYVDFTAQINASAPDGQICNTAFIRSDTTSITNSNQFCVTVKRPATPVTIVTPTVPPTTVVEQPKCPYNSSLLQTDVNCKPCVKSTNNTDVIVCMTPSKTATNVTQNIADANNTTAHPGDTIKYTLTVANPTKSTASGYKLQDSMSDVLDYADIVDAQGGTLDKNNNLVWSPTDIKAGQTFSKTITVKVKDPIPQTPASTTDPGHFDLVMTNVFGNTINIKVPGAPAKVIATTTSALPDTGAGTSVLVIGVLVVIVAYFFARSRLMAKELDIVRTEQNTAGGL